MPAFMKTRFLTLVCFVTLFFFSRTSWAAISLYLNMSNIAGDSTTSGHTADVVISSYAISTMNNTTNKPSFTLSLTKTLSLNSPTFAADCANGTTNQSATISVYNSNVSTTTAIYSVAVSNVVVTADSVSGGTANQQSEQISLSFKSITWTYVPQNPDGTLGTPIVTSYSSP
jgi:type VI protein secretion system component Hcp